MSESQAPTRAQRRLLETVADALKGADTVTIVDAFTVRRQRPNISTVNACVERGWIARASTAGIATIKWAPIVLTDKGRDVLGDRDVT